VLNFSANTVGVQVMEVHIHSAMQSTKFVVFFIQEIGAI